MSRRKIERRRVMHIHQSQVERQAEEEEEPLQTKRDMNIILEVTKNLKSYIQEIQYGSRPLSKSESTYFELRFGHDSTRVHLHIDAQAVESALAVNAKAYTRT